MFQAELVRKDAERKGRLSERTLISYDELWRLYLEPTADHALPPRAAGGIAEPRSGWMKIVRHRRDRALGSLGTTRGRLRSSFVSNRP